MSKPYLISLSVDKGPNTIRQQITALQREIAGLEKQLSLRTPAKPATPPLFNPVAAYARAVEANDKKTAAALFKTHKKAIFASRKGKPLNLTK